MHNNTYDSLTKLYYVGKGCSYFEELFKYRIDIDIYSFQRDAIFFLELESSGDII